jgi:5-formyltetrahydrofolate cyclo-ligase
MSDKSTLRAEALARRGALTAAARAEASRAAAERLLDALPAAPGLVSVFMSIGDEIDTAPLIAGLSARGLALALPCIAARGRPLVFRRWMPGDPLDAKVWGIREPPASAPAASPDTLVCPLVAFDRRGGRVGHGAGYYDMSLAALRAQKSVVAIGYAFACQEAAEVPLEEHDEPLDLIVTEHEVIAPMRAPR